MQNTTSGPPAAARTKLLTTGEVNLRFFARDMSESLRGQKLNVGPGGSMACAFLRQTFPDGLPPNSGSPKSASGAATLRCSWQNCCPLMAFSTSSTST